MAFYSNVIFFKGLSNFPHFARSIPCCSHTLFLRWFHMLLLLRHRAILQGSAELAAAPEESHSAECGSNLKLPLDSWRQIRPITLIFNPCLPILKLYFQRSIVVSTESPWPLVVSMQGVKAHYRRIYDGPWQFGSTDLLLLWRQERRRRRRRVPRRPAPPFPSSCDHQT